MANGGNGGSGIVIIRYSSTKTTENAIDSTNKLQIPAGSVITKTKGTFSPYSLYWDGDLNDNSDNSYLTSSLNNLTPPLSISFWKKQDKLVSEETLSITNKLSLSINSNLAVKFSVGSTTEIIENQADLDWHFWTITSDGSDNKLYRDGRVLLGSAITAPLTLSATDELMIGSNLLGQNDASPSYLEDLRIWKKSLTHQQIIDCMSIYPGYKNHANDLYLWYKFEDHPWNTSNIKDYSGDKRDGTIINNVSSGTFDDGYPGYKDHENNLVAWYKFDDATNINYDSISKTNAGTVHNSGSVSSSTTNVRGTNSIYFSGNSTSTTADGFYLDLNISTETIFANLTSNSFSIVFWFNFVSSGGSTGGKMFNLFNKIRLENTNADFTCDGTSVSSAFTTNTYYHLSIILDNISQTIKVYVDGIYREDLSSLSSDFSTLFANNYIYLGGHDSKKRSAEGYLDDFRIYDKALSETEVKQIYGYTLSRQQGRISPYAYFFNGSTTDATDNAYITKDTITDFPSTFSIAFWKRCLDKSVEGKSFVLSTASTNVIEIDVSNTVNFRIDNSSNILEDYNDVSWHHWVFTYSGTEMDIYKDGMNRVGHMINKKTGLTALDFTTVDHTIYVGGYQHGDASPSYLEDFRIYNKVLSGIEIQQIYSEWTGDIVDKKDNLKLWYQLNNNPVGIPDYPIFAGHESNLIAWYKFDGDDVADSSGNGNDLESVSLDGTLQTDFVYPSLKIPENNKYLFPLAITETLMTQNWSISFYVKISGIVIIRYSSTKTTENAIDSTNKLQIPAGSVITKTIGTFSPYSLYWDGDLNDNSDNSYLTSSLNNLTPPLSISFWKKQDKLVSEETLSITNKLSLSINSNLAVKFSVGSTTEIIENQADLDWHFWTITSDGSDNKLYRDGRVLLGSAITAPLTLSATDELMIGSNLLGQNDASPSYLEDLRIWKKSLTHQQIIDCMSIYPGYKNHANDLYLWYKFEDHPWNTSNIKDYSGDERDGTITNNVSSGTFDDGYPRI